MPFSSRATRTCPLSCDCVYKNDGMHVLCWNPLMDKIPRLSANTSSVSFEHVSALTLGDDVFKTATNMYSLRFSSCKMSRITTGSLNGLQRLIIFSIFALPNFPVTLERSVLSNLTSLTHLSIVRNNLQYFPSNMLCELPLNSKVEELNLSQNKITHMRMDICIRSHLPVLNVLNLNANPLVYLSGDDLQPLGNVNFRFLTMTATHIETLEPDVLKYIPHLTGFTIESDRLVSLPDGMFSAANISNLNLAGKYLKYIPQAIDLARSIHAISFRGNDSSQVSFGVNFQTAGNLHSISISYVPIGVISYGYFQNLINSPVEEITFNWCKIESISIDAFNAFSKSLQQFNFVGRHTSLSNLSQILTNISMALINATNLKSFFFKSTRVKYLNKYTFRGFSNSNIISDLKLNDNDISSIDSDTFSPFTQLKYLDFGKNKRLSDDGLKEKCFSGLIRLEHLSLRDNSFKRIPVCSRVNLSPSLKILDMSDNYLEYFTHANFAGYYNLESLYLGGNNIRNIGSAMVNLTNLNLLILNTNGLVQLLADDLKTLSNLKKTETKR